jgi:hypothetical protein
MLGVTMSKSRRDSRGNTREQRFQHENDKLKRTISLLRKQMARIDLDKSADVRAILNNYYAQEDAFAHAEKEAECLELLKKEWQCNQCETGVLEIILLNKMDSLHYFRKCCDCAKRTKLQPYNKNVRGIVKK